MTEKPKRSARPNEWSMGLAREFAEALGDSTLPFVLFRPLVEGTSCMPLKIGIHRDLQAAYPNNDWKKLRKALRRYCTSALYLAALRDGRPRYNMWAVEVSPMSERHQKHGERSFKRVRARLAKRSGPNA